jgi:hypothetical protein
MLLSSVLARLVVRASTVYRFVRAVLIGCGRKGAWQREVGGALSISSGYRLWQRMREAQVRIRTLLCRLGPPPACNASEPMAQMMAHLEHVFPAAPCPLSAFQSQLQAALFG